MESLYIYFFTFRSVRALSGNYLEKIDQIIWENITIANEAATKTYLQHSQILT